MSDDSAILNEIYQEMYAMRSRIEYLAEIQKEVYAMRSRADNLEGIMRQIHSELVAIRRGFGVEMGGGEEVSVMRQRTTSKSPFNFFRK